MPKTKPKTLCRDCEFCVITENEVVDSTGNKIGKTVQNGWCHLNPPILIGPAQTTYTPVAVDPKSPAAENFWCSHGKPRATSKQEKPRV